MIWHMTCMDYIRDPTLFPVCLVQDSWQYDTFLSLWPMKKQKEEKEISKEEREREKGEGRDRAYMFLLPLWGVLLNPWQCFKIQALSALDAFLSVRGMHNWVRLLTIYPMIKGFLGWMGIGVRERETVGSLSWLDGQSHIMVHSNPSAYSGPKASRLQLITLGEGLN